MKTLIVKTSALGDIVQAFHVLPYLKSISSDMQIDWVAEQPFAELPKAHPSIRRVFTIETKKWRRHFWKREIWQEIKRSCYELSAESYDLVLDLQGNTKSGIVTALAKAPKKVGFGYATISEWPNVLFTNEKYNPPHGRNIREDYLFLVKQAFEEVKEVNEVKIYQGICLRVSEEEEKKIESILDVLIADYLPILVCPGSNWSNKQLSYDCLKEFLEQLNRNFKVQFLFIWGSKEEALVAQRLTLEFPSNSWVIDKLSLPTLQNLISRLGLVIAMDSLPLHLAATTSTPTYSIFGASAAAKYKPIGIQHYTYQGGCPYKRTFEKRCPILRSCSTGSCIKDLSGEAIFEHFREWWETLNLVN